MILFDNECYQQGGDLSPGYQWSFFYRTYFICIDQGIGIDASHPLLCGWHVFQLQPPTSNGIIYPLMSKRPSDHLIG